MALALLFQLRATATIPGWGRVLRLDRRPSSEIWGRFYKNLTFHPARRQTVHQPALRQQEHDRNRDGGEYRRGGKVAPQIVLRVEILLHTYRQGIAVHIAQQQRGDRHFGDSRDERQNKDHRQNRHRQRQQYEAEPSSAAASSSEPSMVSK